MTIWCNHLTKQMRGSAVTGLKRVIGALGVDEPSAWTPARSVGGISRDASGAKREWSAELTWRDAQILAVDYAPDTASPSNRFSITEDLRCRRTGEPQRGIGQEAQILSDWLKGFEPAAVDPAVLAQAGQQTARTAALLEAAAWAFDLEWHHLYWRRGRGRLAPVLSLSIDRTDRLRRGSRTVSVQFSDRLRPRIHRAYGPQMARTLAREGGSFMHVYKAGVSGRNGVMIEIGAGAPISMLREPQSTVEILRIIASIPEGVSL